MKKVKFKIGDRVRTKKVATIVDIKDEYAVLDIPLVSFLTDTAFINVKDLERVK